MSKALTNFKKINVFLPISGGKEPSESLENGCLEVLLASNSFEQGKFKQHVKQTCFRELACQQQLEGQRVGKLEASKKLTKTIGF